MPTQTIHIVQDFKVPSRRVFEFFRDHERLQEIWTGKFSRIREGEDSPNGLGSVRLVELPGSSFEETITRIEEPSRIEYTITKGGPLKSHYGIMRFIDNGDGTSRMDYTIEIESKVPLTTGIIRMVMQAAMGNGVRKLARRMEKDPTY